MLHSPGATPFWESKMLTQCIETVSMNDFLVWRVYRVASRGERDHQVKHLDLYRHLLNNQSSFVYWIVDLRKELLQYSSLFDYSSMNLL